MTDHTSGPWTIDGNKLTAYIVGKSDTVAHIPLSLTCPRRRERSIADARLIAAAPDLYAALGQCHDLLRAMLTTIDPEDLFPHVSMKVIEKCDRAAESALSRARGE